MISIALELMCFERYFCVQNAAQVLAGGEPLVLVESA